MNSFCVKYHVSHSIYVILRSLITYRKQKADKGINTHVLFLTPEREIPSRAKGDKGSLLYYQTLLIRGDIRALSSPGDPSQIDTTGKSKWCCTGVLPSTSSSNYFLNWSRAGEEYIHQLSSPSSVSNLAWQLNGPKPVSDPMQSHGHLGLQE